MFRIKYGKGLWVSEYRCCFVKSYSVFIPVIMGLYGIPLKIVIDGHVNTHLFVNQIRNTYLANYTSNTFSTSSP